MSARKARRLVAYKDFTHYLSFPLVTPSSRQQLHASFARFERETSAFNPKGSVRNSKLVRLNLGRLNLKSKERIDACSNHLHGLDMHEMLRVAAVNALGGPPRFDDLPYIGDPPHAFGMTTTVDYSPLKVDVFGLFSFNDCPSQTRTLGVSVIDRTHRLQHFSHILLDSLFKADFLANAFHPRKDIVSTAVPANWGHRGVCDPRTKRWSHPGRPRSPRIDARGIIQDHQWATDVQLEKLCVQALGSRQKLSSGSGARMKQTTEIDSIALPSFAKSMT
ncbi:hypothetical protein IMSHALPRED_004054 [Imshaugia aleurites]|uniref:Uncharacterized protein n=1 Tax=Imshaugia aleurites TaxID=172621 RepID=A0A8H3EFY7_9LECA|nr:hypothetical protein IMSHALPRED_004054 [Imshaugia aleurites]